MKSTDTPEQGRLSPEAYADRLRESRKRTTEMKRQYRDMRRKQKAEDAAKRWRDNHQEKHDETDEDMNTLTMRIRRPLNRRERRHYAKQMNAFKLPRGWKMFNDNYRKRFGYSETVSRGIRKLKEQRKADVKASKLALKTQGEQ